MGFFSILIVANNLFHVFIALTFFHCRCDGKKKQTKMILSGTPLATIRHMPPISVTSTTNDASSTSSEILGELLISSNIHRAHRPMVTISLSAATTTPTVTIPAGTVIATTGAEESNFASTSLILSGNAPSAFRPIIPSTSSDSFVVTTLNSLVSPSDHENRINERRHHRHHHHYHHPHHHYQRQNNATVNDDYGEFIKG